MSYSDMEKPLLGESPRRKVSHAFIAITLICVFATTILVRNNIGVVETLVLVENGSFPEGFRWGVATASYQVEGAIHDANRTPSIWDEFCEQAVRCNGTQTLMASEGCERLSCASVADDFFHRYKDDIANMTKLNVTSYRMSISWSRLMSWNSSQRKMVANPAGVAFYQEVFHELRRWSIEPMVTIYHWDLPLALQNNLEPAGWLNPNIGAHFEDFATLCFQEFGQFVPLWFTVNEPWSFTVLGYTYGAHAPGNSGSEVEAYTVGHHVLIAHAMVVRKFRALRKQAIYIKPEARISFVLNIDFGIPLNASNPADVIDARAYNMFILDWFLHPVVYGTYPPAMRQRAGTHLPIFTDAERALVNGSLDGFLGLNHYTTHMITSCNSSQSSVPCSSLKAGWQADLAVDGSRHPIGSRKPGQEFCMWLQGYPEGYGLLLDYVHNAYPDLKILLTENGWCGEDIVDDQNQLWYYKNYLAQVHAAISRGVPIIGYTAWSLMDNYEWGTFRPRFGLWHVNYSTQERTPKTAALWLSRVMGANKLYH